MVFNGPTTQQNLNVVQATASGTLTLAPGITIRGGGGTLGATGTTTIVQGLVLADAPNARIELPANAVTNQGTLGAIGGGILRVQSPTPSSALLYAGAGGLIELLSDFTQTSAGTLEVEVGGLSSTQVGHVSVAAGATLAGTLNIARVNGFTPLAGARFQFMTFSTRTGLFDTINGTDLGGGHTFALDTSAATELDLLA